MPLFFLWDTRTAFRWRRCLTTCNLAPVADVLTQAVLDAPMFTVRWRWNASRALAVLRWRSGRKVAPQLQRMNAEDLVAAVFPDQLACAENLSGEREIPDHPLVQQTLRDCLEEAMDIDGLESLLRAMERNEKTLVARDSVEPSPLAAEILSARPYAFLDDAPLEERRTQAVYSRRWLDPEKASDLGQLDAAAIARVREEAWPQPENPDELHDALLQLGFLTENEGIAGSGKVAEGREERIDMAESEGWKPFFNQLASENRVVRLVVPTSGNSGFQVLWIAAERSPEFQSLFPNVAMTNSLAGRFGCFCRRGAGGNFARTAGWDRTSHCFCCGSVAGIAADCRRSCAAAA